MCKCTQRVITRSNLDQIEQSNYVYLQGSRDSQLSARKTPGPIQASVTELHVCLISRLGQQELGGGGGGILLYKKSQSTVTLILTMKHVYVHCVGALVHQ